MVFSISVRDAETAAGPTRGAGRRGASEPGYPGPVPGAVLRSRPGDSSPAANRGDCDYRIRSHRVGGVDGARGGDHASQHGGPQRGPETSAAVARTAAGAARGD